MARRVAGPSSHGNPEARRIADDALGIFAETFAPFAAERYGTAYGPTWMKDRGFGPEGVGARIHSIEDPQELFSRLATDKSPEFDRAFAPVLVRPSGFASGPARELTALRNDLVHRTRPWEAADAWRLVDRTRALLDAFGLLEGDVGDRLEELAREAGAVVAGDRSTRIDELRREYVEGVLEATQWVDTGGINAHVGSRVVRVRLEEVYVEPTLARPDTDADEVEPIPVHELPLARRVVVLGGPGSGKSTLLRHLARTLVLGEVPATRLTPIIVLASDLAVAVATEPGLSLRRYLTQRRTERFGEVIGHELELGRAMVLLDALDEVSDETARTRVMALVGDFTQEYPNVALIVASRPVGYRRPSSWSGFAELAIAPLDDDQISEFVERWAAVLTEPDEEAADASALIEEIGRSEGARGLASTPLLLTILVLLWHRGARLPERLAELYDLATSTLLHDWPIRRLGHSFSDRHMLDLLRPVAFELIESGAATIGELQLLDRWTRAFLELERLASPDEARGRAEQLLRLIEEHTGFFVELGREAGERQYGFLHRTFAEYLAALELAERWDAGDLDLDAFLHVSRWQEVVDLFVGHVGLRGMAAGSSLASAILAAEPPFEAYLRRDVPLLVRLIGRGLELRPDLRDRILSRAVEQALEPALEPFRTSLGRALARLAPTVPRAVIDAGLARETDDPPMRRARKSWLRLLVRPDSDERLGELINALGPLMAGAVAGEADVQYAMRAIGVRFTDEVEAGGLYLRIGGDWYVPDAEAAERLAIAGVPSLAVAEIAADASSRAGGTDAWLTDPESYDEARVSDIVALLGHDDAFWPIVYTVIDDVEWQDERAAEIEGLVERVEELPPEAASYALTSIDLLDPGPARLAWMDVLHAMIVAGGTAARQLALARYLRSAYAVGGNGQTMIAEALAADPVSVRGVPLALMARPSDPDPALIEITETMAHDHADPVTRGLARRALAVAIPLQEPLKVLSSPDVAVPAEAMIMSPGDDTTGEVISLLLIEEGSEDAQAAAAAIARAIIEVGTYVDYDLAAGEPVQNPPFDRLARDLARSSLPESRCWSARLLQSLDRPPARLELGVLLADPDAKVRATARYGIQEVDLAETAWLEDLLPRWFPLETGPEAADLPALLVERLPAMVLEDLALLAEAYLDDHPGNPGALFLLAEAASAGIGTTAGMARKVN